MSVAEILQTLSSRQVRIKLDGDSLQFNAPKGALTPDLQRLLKDNKSELINWLKTHRKIADDSDSPLEQIQHDAMNQNESFPLSDLQVAFYMANDPFMEFQVRPHYYMENTYDNLDVHRYEKAWNKALQRHQKELVLLNDQEQLALIQPAPELNIPVLDLSGTSGAEVTSALEKVRQDMMRSELSLNRWPWFDLRISRWTENGTDRCRVHYNNNNFYSDGLGTTGLLKEVWEYYEQPDNTREPIEIGFRDAVMALEQLERSEKGRAARDYWLKKIAALPAAPAIPLIPGKERRVRARMNRREFFVDPQTWNSFKSNAAEYGLTSSNAVLAVQAKVLSVYSGQEHFILSHMATRRLPVHRQIKEILGNFASLYPLEVDLRGDQTFADSAQRLQRQVMEDSAQLYWGGMKVMRELNKQTGEMGASPCPYVVGSGIFMGAYDKPEFSCLETSQTLLDHQFWELTDGRFYGVWDLLEEFYPAGLIDSMWDSYQTLFLRLARDKSTWSSSNLCLTPARDLSARQRLNASARLLPGGLLQSPLANLPKDRLDRPATITKARPLSYRELDEQSNTLAHTLIESGVTRGARVALVMERGNALTIALAAVLKAGGAYVPVNPDLPEQRSQYLIENCGAKHILTEAKWRVSLAALENTKVIIETETQGNGRSDQCPNVLVDERDLAYIIYTSGSTGTPKGVAISHQGAVNTIQDINRKFDVSPRDRIMAVSAYSFDLSVYDVFGAWDAGAAVLYPDPEAAYNPSHWFDLMDKEGATIWNSAPPLMSLLAETGIRQSRTLPGLRLVMLSGDWIPLALPDQIKKIAPNAKVISLGGATEASIWSIYYPIERVSPEWSSIPYGIPLANQSWHILDRQGNPVPTYTSGELYIGGKGLALEYWGDPEKSERSFIHHPVIKERLYRTGDQGRYLPDGTIEFLGRLDGQIKIQGHRIELGEIEAALRHGGQVTDSVVVAQAGRDHHDKRLVAHVIPQDPVDDESVFAQTLQAQLQKTLPSYMVPKTWNVVDHFPITTNGKIDRKALADMAPLEIKVAESQACYATRPAPGTERSVYDIWARVLGHENFGTTEDFFDIGGQSFDAVRIAGLLGEKFKMPLSLGDMWRERTIQNIARYLDGGSEASDQSHLVALTNTGANRPLFMVHPAGGYCVRYRAFSQRLNRPVYGLQASGLDGRSEALDDIPEMARRYLQDIRSEQPNGPYQIGGWSSGGLIAFEMVRQLREQGQKVEPLWIIDCPSPHEHESVSPLQMVHWFLEDMALDLPVDRLVGRVDESKSARDLLGQAIKLLNAEVQTNLNADLLWPIFNVFSHIVAAGRRYAPPPIDVNIVLCRARDGQVSEFSSHPYHSEAHWGWALLTKGQVHAEFCPGTHHSLLDHEHVDAVTSMFSRSEVECEPV